MSDGASDMPSFHKPGLRFTTMVDDGAVRGAIILITIIALLLYAKPI